MSVHTPYQKHTWVTKEIIRREYLQNIEDGIYQEQQDAEAAETALENALAAEEQRARSSETTIQNNLTAEVTRATAAEEEITQGIQDDLDELSERISNEYTRATQAESALQDYVDQKVATTYKASGSIYFADLPALTESRQGNVYNIKDAFITTADFAEGAGKSYPQGTNVAIVGIEEGGEIVYKYDVQAGFIDTSHLVSDTDYATTSNAGIVKPDGTTVTVDANGVLSSTGSSVSPQGIGFGYGTCVTAEATIAKEASLTGYNLVKNGYVSIKFSNAVPASATLNIDSKGAKPIYYHGVAITADIIGAGDLATFVYDGTNYNLVGVDNVSSQIQTLTNQVSDKADTVSVISDVYEVTTPAFSSLPQTFIAQGITANHKLVVDGYAKLSNPSAQSNDWTVTTGANTITISGTFNGSTATTVTMTLGVKRTITATA